MLRIDANMQSPAFRGLWGDPKLVDDKKVLHYYPFIDETKDEIELEVNSKLKSLNAEDSLSPKWAGFKKEFEAIVTEPLKITKNDFARFNRGFMSDTLAKLLLKW